MAKHVKPMRPVKDKTSRCNRAKLGFMKIMSYVLWAIIIVAALNILVYYPYTFFTKGPFDTTTLQYAVIVSVGAYFCLIQDKKKIYEALGVKNVPKLTPEGISQVDDKDKERDD